MRIGRIVGAGVGIWGANWFRWFVVTIALTGVLPGVVAALDPWTATFGAPFWTVERGPLPDPNRLAVALSLVNSLLLTPWLLVILTRATLRATFPEEGPRSLVGRTIQSVHSILWIIILALLAFLGVAIVIAIPFAAASDRPNDPALAVFGLVFFGLLVWLGPRLATVPQVLIGEDARGTRAYAGAWRLSRGQWGTSAAVAILGILLTVAIGVVPAIVAFELFPDPVVGDAVPRAVVQSLVSGLVTPLGISVVAALYLELRARKGVLDQTLLRSRLARYDAS
jgi:hypothetical protein